MTTIYKYPLSINRQILSLPKNAQLLSVGLDPQEKLCLWANVDPSETEIDALDIIVLGTGHEVPKGIWRFIGTVKHMEKFMWHIFVRQG